MLSKNNALRSILTKNQNLEYNENEFYKYLRQVRELKHSNNQRFLNCRGVHGYPVKASITNPVIDSLNQANIHELNIKSSLARTKQANFNYNVLEELQPHEGKQTVRSSMKKLLDYFPGLQQKEQEKFKSDLDADKEILQADKSEDVLENENLMMGKNTEQAGVEQAYQMALDLAIDRFHRQYPSAVELGLNAGTFINRESWSGTELLSYVTGSDEIFFQKNPQFFSQFSNNEAALKDPTNLAYRVEEIPLPASSNYMNDPKSDQKEAEFEYLSNVSEKLSEDILNVRTTLNSLQKQQLHPLEQELNSNETLLSIQNTNRTQNVIDSNIGELSSSSNPFYPNMPIDKLMLELLRLQQEKIKLIGETEKILKEASTSEIETQERFNFLVENNKNSPSAQKEIFDFLKNQKTANATKKKSSPMQNVQNIGNKLKQLDAQYRDGRNLLYQEQFFASPALTKEELKEYINRQGQELMNMERIALARENEVQMLGLTTAKKVDQIYMNTALKIRKNKNIRLKEEDYFDLSAENLLDQFDFPNVSLQSTNEKKPVLSFSDLPRTLPRSGLASVPVNSGAPVPVAVNPIEVIDLTAEQPASQIINPEQNVSNQQNPGNVLSLPVNLPPPQYPDENLNSLPLKQREPLLSPAERREAKKKQEEEIRLEKMTQNPLPLDEKVDIEEIPDIIDLDSEITPVKKIPPEPTSSNFKLKPLKKIPRKPGYEWVDKMREEIAVTPAQIEEAITERKKMEEERKRREEERDPFSAYELSCLRRVYDKLVSQKGEKKAREFYREDFTHPDLPGGLNIYQLYQRFQSYGPKYKEISFKKFREMANEGMDSTPEKKFYTGVIQNRKKSPKTNKKKTGNGQTTDEQSDEEETESTGKGKRKCIDDSITISSEFAPLGTGFLHVPSAHDGRVRITDEKGQDIPSLCFDASSNLCRALLAKSKGRSLGRLGARDAQTARVILHALQGEAIAPPQNPKKQRKELLESMLHNGNDSQGVKTELKHMMELSK